MKIDLPIICRVTDDIIQYYSVEAELIFDLAPHIVATWAVHREYGLSNKWIVTNLETGARVSAYWGSRRKAIEEARIKLAGISQSKYDMDVNKLPRMCRK